ncbi:hypothetical protein E2C01_052183 [Portunus trituberculatus]|uniref:Uncharacterized protein n=1 Tax=Portunus trituberculatus TaxID=210409 RepID=A0A5B7GMC3_PORTR|nr:hypothetical protein [Portunus trituberculatus]
MGNSRRAASHQPFLIDVLFGTDTNIFPGVLLSVFLHIGTSTNDYESRFQPFVATRNLYKYNQLPRTLRETQSFCWWAPYLHSHVTTDQHPFLSHVIFPRL